MKKLVNENFIFLFMVSYIVGYFVFCDDDIFGNGGIFFFCRIVFFVCYFNKKKFCINEWKLFKDGGMWCGRWYLGFFFFCNGG